MVSEVVSCLSSLRSQFQISVITFPMRLEPSPRVKSKSQRSAESQWVFSKYSGFLPQGNLTGCRVR